MPRIVFELVLHRRDDAGQRIQPDHVGQPEGGRLRPADRRPGQRIDGIEAQAQAFGVRYGREDGKGADAIGDEVRGIAGAHHALAQRLGEENLELVEDRRIGAGVRDQFDQVHVARRVEEVHAAEARAILFRQHFGQFGDRKPGGVGSEDRIAADVLFDLVVQRFLDVDAFGDRLDDEVAVFELVRIVFEVGRMQEFDQRVVGQRRRLEFAQALNGAFDKIIAPAFLCRKVEQPHRNAGGGQVRSDLRAHDTGAEHRGFSDDESVGGHGVGGFLVFFRWIREFCAVYSVSVNFVNP